VARPTPALKNSLLFIPLVIISYFQSQLEPIKLLIPHLSVAEGYHGNKKKLWANYIREKIKIQRLYISDSNLVFRY
jgi:hypothetical protein